MKVQTGRPTVMTVSTVQKLEQALRDGFSVEMACHVSGVARSTYYAHVDRDQDFSHKMELAQQWPTQRAKQVVVQAINKGDLTAAKWWLERRSRAEFAANPPITEQQSGGLFYGHDNDKLIPLIADTMAALAEA